MKSTIDFDCLSSTMYNLKDFKEIMRMNSVNIFPLNTQVKTFSHND